MSTGISTGSFERPIQKNTLAEKTKKREGYDYSEWGRKNVDYYYARVEFYEKDYDDLYKAAEGILTEDDYGYITRPFGDDQPDKQYPAQLFNYGAVIPTNVDLLLGEFRQRKAKKHVVVKSPEEGVAKKDAEDQLRMQLLKQMYINELNAQGLDTGMESQEIDMALQMERFNRNWNEEKRVEGAHALNAIDQDLKLSHKWADGFYHWLVTNRIFTYKDIWNNDLQYEIVDPREIGYVAGPNDEYLEDSEAVVRKVRMTRTKAIEKFWDVLTEDEIEKLMQDAGAGPLITTKSGRFVQEPRLPLGEDRANDQGHRIRDFGLLDYIYVVHVTWKSLRKVGVIQVPDPITGEMQDEYVDETYKPSAGEEVEWRWVNWWWEGYVIGEDTYCCIRPIPFQRMKMDNPSSSKGLYNGKINRGISVVEKLMPYEHLYNFGMYLFNKALGKNKDKFMFIPKGIIPQEDDMNLFDMLYYIDATGLAVFDDSNPKALQALQYMKVYDMDFGKFVAQYVDWMESVKRQGRDRIGITPQRMGDIKSSAGKGTTEEAIFRSYNISEDLFASFHEFMEKEYQGFLDLAKYAWTEGKRGSYMKNGNQLVEYAIRPESFQETDMGVYVMIDSSEDKKLEMMKQMGLTFAQNEQSPHTIAEIINADDFGSLMDDLKALERKSDALGQQQLQAQQQAVMQEQQLKMQELAQEREIEFAKIESDNLNSALDREVELIKAGGDIIGQGPGEAEAQKEWLETNRFIIDQEKVNVEREKMRTQERIKDKELASKERIEKLKAKTALKNKVPGEKS